MTTRGTRSRRSWWCRRPRPHVAWAGCEGCTRFGWSKKYRIRLTTDEQQELNALVSRGRAAAYKQTHARILLMSDESRSDGGMKDADITSALGVGQSTVERIRKRCVEEGVESALNRKKQLRRRQKRLDGEGEARLIEMACGEPPEGACQLDPEAVG